MRKVQNNFILLLIFLTVSPIISTACSIYREPKSKFDPKLYIFIGEVIGFTDKSESKGVIKNGSGLRIKVLESVNLPEEPTNGYFEVFPYDISPGCQRYIGLSEKYVQENYPLNSKVRIITDDFFKLTKKDKTTRSILRVEPFLHGGMFINDLKDQISATSVFNYADAEDYYRGFFEFEILKDLKRLEESSSDEEKVKIFERLIHLPKRLIDFETTVQTYIKNPEIRQTLVNKRKNLE